LLGQAKLAGIADFEGRSGRAESDPQISQIAQMEVSECGWVLPVDERGGYNRCGGRWKVGFQEGLP
jgi:hypothetical protein